MAFSPDGRLLAAISTDGSVIVLGGARGGAPRIWDSEDADAGLALVFSRDGKRLASANGSSPSYAR